MARRRSCWPATAALAGALLLLLQAPVDARNARRARIAYSAFSISFLNLFVARDTGLFTKHGVDAELIQMAGPAVRDYSLLDQVLAET